MRRFPLILVAAALIPLVACERQEPSDSADMNEGAADFPVTTESAEALDHFNQGRQAADMGRFDDAILHYDAAIAADPTFAYAHLERANAGNSLEEFQAHLALAEENAAGASEPEKILIEIARKGLDGDLPGQLAAAQRLTEAQGANPRAWMALSAAQSANSDEAAARASLDRAVELAPDNAPAHMALANSWLFLEPRDFAMAQTHAERAAELAPEEAVPQDILGDVYRAQGQLEEAAAAYGRTAELDPESGAGYQQRAHVHSFLGDYAAARADYDAAIEIEKGKNAEPSFGVYRALVSVHEGNPAAAITELEELLGRIDGMGVPEARGQKIFTLNTIARIAMHSGNGAAAASAIERRDVLLAEQGEVIGNESARRFARAAAAISQGELAAYSGDYATATAKAAEYMTIMEPDTDPAKNEPAHALLGYVALQQGNAEEAIAHFEQADPDDVYAWYYRATALEAAGRADEAKALFGQVATNNFNSPELALVRSDAAAKTGS
jgi:tetratricopeptide (TPR) repeat protein